MIRLVVMIISYLPLEQFLLVFEMARHLRISRRMQHCGNRVVFSIGFLVEDPKTISIGDDVSFGPNVSIMGVGGCQIGTNTMVASRTLILTTSHDPSALVMRNTAIHKSVVIEDNVWIGAGAILLPGITVRQGAVIGAGAVVTNDVGPNQIVSGIPARFLRDRLTS